MCVVCLEILPQAWKLNLNETESKSSKSEMEGVRWFWTPLQHSLQHIKHIVITYSCIWEGSFTFMGSHLLFLHYHIGFISFQMLLTSNSSSFSLFQVSTVLFLKKSFFMSLCTLLLLNFRFVLNSLQTSSSFLRNLYLVMSPYATFFYLTRQIKGFPSLCAAHSI